MSWKRIFQLLLTPLPSALKVPVYRALGADIHTSARVSACTVLAADRIVMGPESRVRGLSIIQGLSNFELGAYSVVSNLCVINGSSELILGARSFIRPGCMIDLRASVSMGEYSAFGPRCTVMTHGVHWPTSWGFARKTAPVEIGDLVWIANNCHIGPGVSLGSELMLMPNSTVARNVKGPGMVFDSSVERRSFPIQLLKKRVDEAFVRRFVQNLIHAYYRDQLRPLKYQLIEEEGRYLLKRGRVKVLIHLFEMSGQPRRGVENWLFAYAAKPAALADSTDCSVVDFLRLLHSSGPSKALRRALGYFGTVWGLYFADYQHREHFHLEPPRLDNGS